MKRIMSGNAADRPWIMSFGPKWRASCWMPAEDTKRQERRGKAALRRGREPSEESECLWAVAGEAVFRLLIMVEHHLAGEPLHRLLQHLSYSQTVRFGSKDGTGYSSCNWPLGQSCFTSVCGWMNHTGFIAGSSAEKVAPTSFFGAYVSSDDISDYQKAIAQTQAAAMRRPSRTFQGDPGRRSMASPLSAVRRPWIIGPIRLCRRRSK